MGSVCEVCGRPECRQRYWPEYANEHEADACVRLGYERQRAAREKAEALLREALPFIGWTGAPAGLVDRIAAALPPEGEGAGRPAVGERAATDREWAEAVLAYEPLADLECDHGRLPSEPCVPDCGAPLRALLARAEAAKEGQ